MRKNSDDFYERSVGIRDSGHAPSTNITGAFWGRAFTVLARSKDPDAGVNKILDWLV